METALEPNGILGCFIKTHFKEEPEIYKKFEDLCLAIKNHSTKQIEEYKDQLSFLFKFYETQTL